MLKITSHKGFHITFKNGWTASVKFGPGSYSSQHGNWDFGAPRKVETFWESYDAEIAAWIDHSQRIGHDGLILRDVPTPRGASDVKPATAGKKSDLIIPFDASNIRSRYSLAPVEHNPFVDEGTLK
mgnify:CR=1 FL=1